MHHSDSTWPSSRFRLLLGAILCLGAIVLSGCDSNGGGPPATDLDGTFVFTRFELTVEGVDDFDLLQDTLVVASNLPRMEFFAGNGASNLIFRMDGESVSSLITGRFTTNDNRVTVDFSEASAQDRFRLLLPAVVRFQTENQKERLVADQEVQDVNLREYAPDRYDGLTQNVNGTLRLRLERIDT